MNKFIVTTTIYPPSKATLEFAKNNEWILIIIGDLKTPHNLYHDMHKQNSNIWYFDPEYQDKRYKELSDAIGWNSIMRRNIGFIEAYKNGADITATIDDDNIPYSNWGKNLIIGKEIEVYNYFCVTDVFDPLSVTNYKHLWHRGYPLQDISLSRNPLLTGKKKITPLIQASLWDGDPDIDAVCRYIYNPIGIKLESPNYYTSDNYAPFNSQNTFLAREVLPVYMVLPHIGRMDDIWGGYIAQYLLNTRPVFSSPTVYQDRNSQSIEKNFHNEIIGYENTKNLLNDISNFEKHLPEKTLNAFNLYRKEYDKLNV